MQKHYDFYDMIYTMLPSDYSDFVTQYYRVTKVSVNKWK